MSRVPSKIKSGDTVVWSHEDTQNDIKLILTGQVMNEDLSIDAYSVKDIKMHSLESTRGIPADTRLSFPSPAWIPRSSVKKLDEGKWQL